MTKKKVKQDEDESIVNPLKGKIQHWSGVIHYPSGWFLLISRSKIISKLAYFYSKGDFFIIVVVDLLIKWL